MCVCVVLAKGPPPPPPTHVASLCKFFTQVNTQFILEQSDLFESDVHLSEICDILAITVEGIYLYVHVLYMSGDTHNLCMYNVRCFLTRVFFQSYHHY